MEPSTLDETESVGRWLRWRLRAGLGGDERAPGWTEDGLETEAASSGTDLLLV